MTIGGDPPVRTDLLIAGTGFVGSYIAAACEQASLRSHAVDLDPTTLPRALGWSSTVEACDLTDAREVRQTLERCRPRVLVVTAQMPNDGDQQPLEHLVTAAAAAKVELVVLISSLAVYGSAPPHTNGLVESTAPSNPSSYGRMKMAEERALQRAATRTGVARLVLRSVGVFGRLPAPRKSSRAAGAIDRVLREHLSGRLPLLKIEERPDQYLYARELGEVVARAAVSPPSTGILNVGPGHRVTADELQAELSEVLNRPVKLCTVRQTGQPIERLNVDRLDEWFPERRSLRSDLRGGLRSAVKDFEEVASG